ncbi:MAG: hypothetical protein ACRDJ1_06985 [Actinomycetota bacterium]
MSTNELEAGIRVFDSRDDRGPRLPVVAATGSLVAAAIHAWVVRSHAAHWWGYAAFFVAVAVTQAVYAPLVLRRPTRRVAVAGIGANLGILGLYLWSRTVGIPMGPHAGRTEAVGLADLAAASGEIVVVVAVALIARGRIAAPGRSRTSRPAALAILAALVAVAIAGPAGHAHPRATEIRLAGGPETWVGPLPTPTMAEEAPPVEQAVVTEPEPEGPPPCTPSAADGITAPDAAAPGMARAVLSTTHDGTGPQLWMYIPSTNENRKLLTGADTCWTNHPSFRNPGYVSFHTDDALYGLDLSTGTVKMLVKADVIASAWSPDGKTLAYLAYGSGSDEQLVMFDPSDGSKEVVRTFASGGGRCGSEDDETTISWAPDGHALIVVITHLADMDETMFVVDASGEDLVEPRPGTHAAWAPDSRRIYYREFSGDRKWFALNSETGDRGTLGAMKPGTHGLAVSPDGSMLAYADGEDDVGIYVYDVAEKKQRRVAENAVAPIWLGPRTILVTDTKSCGDECSHSAWLPSGTGSTVDVITEAKQKVAIDSTLDADAWLEEPAEQAPAPPAPPPPAPSPAPTETTDPLPLPTPTADPTTDPTPTPSPTPST